MSERRAFSPEELVDQLTQAVGEADLKSSANDFKIVFDLANEFGNNSQLWEIIENTDQKYSAILVSEAKRALFGLLRIAHVEANKYIEVEKAPYWYRISRGLKKVLGGGVPHQLSQDQLFQLIGQLKDHRDRIGLTEDDVSTIHRGVISPLGEATQDDAVTLMRSGEWSAALTLLRLIIAQIELQLAATPLYVGEATDEILTTEEMKFLGIQSALAVLYLRQAEASGSVESVKEALLHWQWYYRYLNGRDLEETELGRHLNHGRMKAITREAMLGALIYPDLNVVKKGKVLFQAIKTRLSVPQPKRTSEEKAA